MEASLLGVVAPPRPGTRRMGSTPDLDDANHRRASIRGDLRDGRVGALEVLDGHEGDPVFGSMRVFDVFSCAYGLGPERVAWLMHVLSLGDWKATHVRDLTSTQRSVIRKIVPMIEERQSGGAS